MTTKTFAVAGGDLRCVHLAELLAAHGNTVHSFALDKCTLTDTIVKLPSLNELKNKYDALLLPLPLEAESGYLNAPYSINSYLIEDIFSVLPPGQKVIAGKVSHKLLSRAGKLGLSLFDYLEREEFSVANAVPSAEGAIQIALEKLPITLNSAKALVIGYGRIGKILARYLSGFGTKVTVSARKFSDFAWISALGYDSLNTNDLSGKISGFDVIFNTVPKEILGANLLRELTPKTLIIDLASHPGGVDLFTAKERGLDVVWALSLPGKVAPLTAAESMAKTVFNILEEWGDTK